MIFCFDLGSGPILIKRIDIFTLLGVYFEMCLSLFHSMNWFFNRFQLFFYVVVVMIHIFREQPPRLYQYDIMFGNIY